MTLDYRKDVYIADESVWPIGGMTLEWTNPAVDGTVEIHGYDGNEMFSGNIEDIRNWQDEGNDDPIIGVPEWVVKIFMDLEIIEDIRTPGDDRVFNRTY